MTFKMPIAGRTFLPDNAELHSTASDTERVTYKPLKQAVSNPDYHAELAAYRKDQRINHLMRQRHGVNM